MSTPDQAAHRLDHIGIVVRNLDATAAMLEKTIGLKLEEIEDYQDILRIGFMPIGGLDIELLEPTTDSGLNADWLRENGEGVHHMAFAVEDLDAAVDHALQQGVKLLLAPTIGARNRRIAFLEGDELGGTIVELVEVPNSE